MKKQTFVLSLSIFFAILMVSSCKVDDTATTVQESDKNSATITLSSPHDGDIFNKDDTVKFIGTIVSKENIHGFKLNFLRKNSADTLYSLDNHAHNDTVAINTFWVNNVTALTDAELIIVVTLDHDGSTAVRKVGCVCKP